MLIPNSCEPTRYFVAINEDEAYASFATYQEAYDCVRSFKIYNLDYFDKVDGILEVSKDKKVWIV